MKVATFLFFSTRHFSIVADLPFLNVLFYLICMKHSVFLKESCEKRLSLGV